MSGILIMEKTYILHLLTFFFFVILFLICLTEFESTKLKCYITTWLCAIDVNTLFLEFSPKKCFSLLTIPSITLNQLFYIGQFKSVSINWGCLCHNYRSSFLPLLIFDWRTFSRRVTARWWRQSAKIKCRPIRTREIRGVSLSDVLYELVESHRWLFLYLIY